MIRGTAVLTADVFGDPADRRRETVDIEVLPIELRALLFTEVFPPSWTRLSVAGAELHPATHAELPAVPGPAIRASRQRSIGGELDLGEDMLCLFVSYSGLLQSLLVLRVPPPQDLEQTL